MFISTASIGPDLWFFMTLLLGTLCACLLGADEPGLSTDAASPLRLDFADDGKQIKLMVQHHEIGLVCELWCYEGGPFRYGTATRREDGSVVFVHTSGKMTATTTFTPRGQERISMDVRVEGPLEELQRVSILGPCMQFWHSEAFQRQETLVDFAERCFLYTMRGPVGMLDTARGPMPDFKSDAPENNPPWTQWYVPLAAPHPGSIWAFGSSGDRPISGVVAVVSRDKQWLAAIGCASTNTLGQGWHDCIHHVPRMPDYLDVQQQCILHRSMIYVMPNDKSRLLEGFQRDFPVDADRAIPTVSIGKKGILRLKPRAQRQAGLDLRLDIAAPDGQQKAEQSVAWEVSPWGGFIRRSDLWTMWAYPHGESVELCVSLAPGMASALVEASLGGDGWTSERAPEDIPALALRSPDGDWSAALLWEQSQAGNPAEGMMAPGQDKVGTISARGRLYLYKGGIEGLRERWSKARTEWEHSRPFSMPIEEVAGATPEGGVRFASAPNAEEPMAYGLSIVAPWKDGGAIHANFPEHFEHGDVGYGITRYSDKRANAWDIASDGRSAQYEVESPELPGVRVRATAVAEGDCARLTFKITNGGEKVLERVKPLLCFWYAKLTGFPGKLSDNFQFTYVVMDGKPTALAAISTLNLDATAKVAYVRGCPQHDCDKFAQSRGGLIERDIDRALIAVTAKDGKRKAVLAFTPGKSILSNAFIPCMHADPYFGTIKPGESREAEGLLIFTEAPIEEVVRTLQDIGTGALKEVT